MTDLNNGQGLAQRIPPVLTAGLLACLILFLFAAIFLLTNGSIGITILVFVIAAGAAFQFIWRPLRNTILDLSASSPDSEDEQDVAVQDPELRRLLAMQNATSVAPDDTMFDTPPPKDPMGDLNREVGLKARELKAIDKNDPAWSAGAQRLADAHLAAAQTRALSGNPGDAATSANQLKIAIRLYQRAGRKLTRADTPAEWLKLQLSASDALLALGAIEFMPNYYEEAVERLTMALSAVPPNSVQAQAISEKRDQARHVLQQSVAEASNDTDNFL